MVGCTGILGFAELAGCMLFCGNTLVWLPEHERGLYVMLHEADH